MVMMMIMNDADGIDDLESHGICFLAFQAWKVIGNLCRVMESHGKLDHYKKIMSWSLLCIMTDKNFTECIFLNYE